MSTGKEIAATRAAECGGIKPWQDAIEEISDDAIVGHEDIRVYMQYEIDELRDDNARLKSALLTNDTTIESANNAAGMLEAENARLRAALQALVNALNSGHSLTIFDALTGAEAALGPNAEVNRNER